MKLTSICQELDALPDVPQVQGIMEGPHGIAPVLCNLQHLRKLLEVAGDQVQEGEPLKVLGLLIAKLYDLMVALSEGLHAQTVPRVFVVQLLQFAGPFHILSEEQVLETLEAFHIKAYIAFKEVSFKSSLVGISGSRLGGDTACCCRTVNFSASDQ